MIPPDFSIFLKVVFAIWSLLCFYTTLRITCSNSVEDSIEEGNFKGKRAVIMLGGIEADRLMVPGVEVTLADGGGFFRLTVEIDVIDDVFSVGIGLFGEGIAVKVRLKKFTVPGIHAGDGEVGVGSAVVLIQGTGPEAPGQTLIVGPACLHDSVWVE